MRNIQNAVLCLCMLILAGCGNSFFSAQKYFTGPVSGVGLKKTTSIIEGGVEQLYAVVTPSKTSNKHVIWSSSDSTVASVDSAGTVIAVKVGSAVITAVTDEGGYKASCAVTVAVKPISITSVTLNKGSSSILIGNTEQLTASIAPVTATNQNLTWTSDDGGIVSVDQTGLVKGENEGKTVIRVTSSDGGFKASCTFTSAYNPVYISDLKINKSATYIQTGKSETLFGRISPSSATNQVLIWSSSNPSVAAVGKYSGVVTAVSEGTADITALTDYTSGGTDLTAISTVNVVDKNVPVDGVSLSKTPAIISVGSSAPLAASITPVSATNQSLLWSSSKSSIASVDSSGVITGVSTGSAVVTVVTVDGTKTASCSVLVNASNVAVTGVSLNKPSTSIQAGKSETLFATVAPELASDPSVTWSSDSTVAAVSGGTVTGVSAGTAEITVTTANGFTAKCICTITAAPIPVSSISLVESISGMNLFSVKTGSSVKCIPIFSPTDATSQGLVWTSSDSAIAKVDPSGIVTGVAAAAGKSATITAKTADGKVSATCIATVIIPVQSVGISKISATGTAITELSVSDGSPLQLYAVLNPAEPSTKTVSWTSLKPAVAEVSTSGLLTPVAPGKATIKVAASDGGYTAYCVVTVSGYTLTYNANGGTGDTPDAGSYVKGSIATVQGNTESLIKTGSFLGWNTDPSGSGVNYTAGQTFTVNGDITLYAQWHSSYYTVGQTGPAAGIIVYDKGSYSNGWQYLEAATTDESTVCMWNSMGTSSNLTGCAGTDIGTGFENTKVILANGPAGLCSLFRNLTKGGYSDWFMPSKGELIAMRSCFAALGSPNNQFWSSSEIAAGYAWTVYLQMNSELQQGKAGGCKVRAMRRF